MFWPRKLSFTAGSTFKPCFQLIFEHSWPTVFARKYEKMKKIEHFRFFNFLCDFTDFCATKNTFKVDFWLIFAARTSSDARCELRTTETRFAEST